MNDIKVLVSKDSIDELLVEQRITNELIEKNTIQLKVMNERQSNENKIGFWFTTVMLMIALFAFYVEIIKLDDINIIIDRTKDFVVSINPWGNVDDKIN